MATIRDAVAGLSGDSGPDRAPVAGDGRSEADRLDRNRNEILQELRVMQTGVQILSGFLLTVPFQQRFAQLSHGQRVLYLVLVLAAALTTALLIAPVSMHRMLFRRGQKERLVALANLSARAGLFSLSVVVSGVLLLVFDVVAGSTLAWTVCLSFFTAAVTGWFIAPLVSVHDQRRRRRGR